MTEQPKDLFGFKLIKVLDFHLIIWPVVFTGGVQVAYTYNLTAMMKSFGLERFSTILLMVYFLGNVLIDRVSNKSLFLLIGGVSISVTIIICLFFGSSVVLFTISIALSSLTNGC